MPNELRAAASAARLNKVDKKVLKLLNACPSLACKGAWARAYNLKPLLLPALRPSRVAGWVANGGAQLLLGQTVWLSLWRSPSLTSCALSHLDARVAAWPSYLAKSRSVQLTSCLLIELETNEQTETAEQVSAVSRIPRVILKLAKLVF